MFIGPFTGGERSFGIRGAEAVVNRSNATGPQRVSAFSATYVALLILSWR